MPAENSAVFHVESPIGRLTGWLDGGGRLTRLMIGGPAVNATSDGGTTAGSLRAYLGGDMAALSLIPVAPAGSPFQLAVWRALMAIPAGETRSYADIARALGGAASGAGANARAVGTANARNPVAVVIPCHRVIGADGSLTGYAAGLPAKDWLLRHEGWRPMQEALL